MELGVDKNPMVMEESDEEEAVEQEYLPTLLALGKKVLVVEQTQVVVDLEVFDFLPGGCRGYLLMIQHVPLNH